MARMEVNPIALRVPAALLAEVDEISRVVMERDHGLCMMLGGMSRSATLRLCVMEGVAALRKRYGGQGA